MATALPHVLDVTRSLGRLGKHVHFHLHDGHPLVPGLRDHFSFLTRLPVPFSYQGRRSLNMMYGPAGLASIMSTAIDACPPQGVSFTAEVHQVEGRLPLSDAAWLFAHWQDTTNAERMNYWLSVLSENAMLMANSIPPVPPRSSSKKKKKKKKKKKERFRGDGPGNGFTFPPLARHTGVVTADRLELISTDPRRMHGQAFIAGTVNGHWEIRLGGLVFSGLAATSFPGWWPRVLPAGGVRWPGGSPPCLPGPRRAGVSRPWPVLGGRGGAAGRRWRWRGSWA